PSDGGSELPDLTLAPVEQTHVSSPFDLSLSLTEVGGGLAGAVEYASDLFDAATIERWSECFEMLLATMIEDELCRVAELPMLPDGQRQQIIRMSAAEQADYPADSTWHELFEAQVQRSPEAVAVE